MVCGGLRWFGVVCGISTVRMQSSGNTTDVFKTKSRLKTLMKLGPEKSEWLSYRFSGIPK